MDETYYTVEQIAQILRMHPKTIQRYIREGKLSATKIGKSWRIAGHDLSRFTEENRVADGDTQKDDLEAVCIRASAVVDVGIRSQERASRIIDSLNAAMNFKPPEYGQASMHTQYLEPDHIVRITLWGNLQFLSAVLGAIEVFTQQGEENI